MSIGLQAENNMKLNGRSLIASSEILKLCPKWRAIRLARLMARRI